MAKDNYSFSFVGLFIINQFLKLMEYANTEAQVSQRDINAKQGLPFTFHGVGGDLFKIHIVNLLLTVITFGIYYPWAKAKILKFNYGETEFKGDRFTFHGTGKEMFMGMIKAFLIIGVLYAIVFGLSYLGQSTNSPALMIIGILILYIGIFAFVPLAIVGSLKYRASRSSWRGIHFQYVGTLKSMYNVFLKGFFLTIITFGIYGAWFMVNIFKEIYSNLRWGNIKLSFKGEGNELFWLNFVGTLLTYITLGFYFFKFTSDSYKFKIDNIRMDQEGNTGGLEAHTSGMGFFKLYAVNALIVIFTLGLGLSWAMVRTMKYLSSCVLVKGYVDFDKLEQGEIKTSDATGEGIMDGLDLDIGF